MVIRFRIQSFIQIGWEMRRSLAFKERPTLGHGLLFIYLLFIIYFIETDYNTSLSRVESLSEAKTGFEIVGHSK